MDPWSVGILKQNTEGTQKHTDTGGVRDLPSAPRHFNAAHVFFITSVPMSSRVFHPPHVSQLTTTTTTSESMPSSRLSNWTVEIHSTLPLLRPSSVSESSARPGSARLDDGARRKQKELRARRCHVKH
ncbi:hypothetical protein B296_00009718 [Ensete ventricosum]|uniref:Uncharacterized protein n=1 Tax=Ensete ventricosum TaxID=4639 RepID=A0A427AF96_ENSVE|nr:hypothetical protein B296_00009718 [Ensete ventricosum]